MYDLLHMMGRDDIPVGLGDVFAVNQSTLCEHDKAIPQGAGGLLDSDTLYGLARDLPRGPRRYHNFVCNNSCTVLPMCTTNYKF